MISPRLFSLLIALLVWQPACADPLYKWVDSEGRVTYSSSPPPSGASAEKMEVAPPPSAEEIRQAEEHVKRTEAQVRELESQRLKQEAKAAEEARLREAQQPKPPIVIEKPVYIPQPIYYPPVSKPRPGRHPVKPPPRHPAKPLPQPLPPKDAISR